MRIVLVGHGTAHRSGQEVGWRIRDQVAARLPEADVRWAWVDVVEPQLPEVLAVVPDAIVVPVFLASGYHVRTDIPAAVAATGSRAHVTAAVGPDLVAAVAHRVRMAEADHGRTSRSVVLGAAGSSRPDAVAEVHAAAERLSELLDRPVTAGFATAAQPDILTAISRSRTEHGGAVTLASWLLAPGYFHDQLGASGADLVTPPIADHPLLVETVLRRVGAA